MPQIVVISSDDFIAQIDKLNIIKQRFDEVSDLIIQPDIIADQKRYVQLNKEYKDLQLMVEKRAAYLDCLDNLKEAEEIIADGSDAEMVEMAKLQLDESKNTLPQLEEEIKFLLIPKILKMPKMWSWKSEPEQEMRQVFSLEICLGCTLNTVNQKVGKQIS